MTILVVLGVVALVGLSFVAFAGKKGFRPGPENNWRNADYDAREQAGNWSEGSIATRSGRGGVTNSDYGAGL